MTRLALVRGAGDLATAAGRRLHRCGFAVVHVEVAKPTAVRRSVAFASAVFEGTVTVEGVTAVLAENRNQIRGILQRGAVAVMVDPDLHALETLVPDVLVDATMKKGKSPQKRPMARAMAFCVVGLGPGFTAGEDVHAVVETNRGHDLGRVIWSGQAEAYTGVPGLLDGAGPHRVLRAPCRGEFLPLLAIGDPVRAGETVASVGSVPVLSALDGVVRGLLHGGLEVTEGQKVGDVDPSGDRSRCFTISDKANAVAGGVLEAVFSVFGIDTPGKEPAPTARHVMEVQG